MDVRKIIFNLIPIILFLLYLYIISSNYFKYRTIANIQRIRNRNDLHELSYTHCVLISAIPKSITGDVSISIRKSMKLHQEHIINNTMNSKEINQIIRLTVNGRNVTLSENPFLSRLDKTCKCWKILYQTNLESKSNIESNPKIEPEQFVLESTNYEIGKNSKIARNQKRIIDKPFNEMNYANSNDPS